MKEQVVKSQQKNDALKNQTVQARELEVQKKEKDAVVRDLKGREKELQKELSAKKKKDQALKNAIATVVRKEIEDAKREAEAKAKADAARNPVTPNTNTSTTTTTPAKTESRDYLNLNAEDVKLNSDFEKNKGKLPWPVDNGAIAIKFGRNSYPIEGSGKPVIIDNPGLTIATPVGSSVKAVFNGEVARVINLGEAQVVIIRHGKYFTTYSNLSSVSVSNGQNVSTGQVIGKAAIAEDGSGGQIDFLLMIEKNQVNPESWLRR